MNYMSYEQASTLLLSSTAALQFVNLKYRMSKPVTEQVEQPRIIQTSLARPWPNQFVFPVQNVSQELSTRLNNPFYDLDRWDVIRLIRILFNEMILYRM